MGLKIIFIHLLLLTISPLKSVAQKDTTYIKQPIFEDIKIDSLTPKENIPPPPPPPPPPSNNSSNVFKSPYKLIHPSNLSEDTSYTFRTPSIDKLYKFFPGCENFYKDEKAKYFCSEMKIKTFIEGNLHYPGSAWVNNIEGIVVAKFLVEKDGSIRDIELIHDIGYGCGEELIRIIERMPNFEPGKARGRPTKETKYVSVEFSKIDYFIKKLNKKN